MTSEEFKNGYYAAKADFDTGQSQRKSFPSYRTKDWKDGYKHYWRAKKG